MDLFTQLNILTHVIGLSSLALCYIVETFQIHPPRMASERTPFCLANEKVYSWTEPLTTGRISHVDMVWEPKAPIIPPSPCVLTPVLIPSWYPGKAQHTHNFVKSLLRNYNAAAIAKRKYWLSWVWFNWFLFILRHFSLFPAVGNNVVRLAHFLSADELLLMYPVCVLTVSKVVFLRKICVISIKRLLGHSVCTAFCK